MEEQKILHRGFNDGLLSLRGIAAMAVLIFHSLLIFQVSGGDVTYNVHLHYTNFTRFINEFIVFLFSGSAAVVFFFVHSGFVLALSLSKHPSHNNMRDKTISLFAFYIKRLFRLYPMIIVSILVSLIYQKYFFHPLNDPLFSTWFRNFYTEPVDFKNLMENIFLSKFNLSPFLWSLRIEVIGSLFMPLIYFASRRVFTTYLMCFLFYLFANNLLPEHTLKVTFICCLFIGTLVGMLKNEIQEYIIVIKSTLAKQKSLSNNSILKNIYSTLENRNFYVLLSLIILIVSWCYSPTIGTAVVIESLASAVIIYVAYYYDEGPMQYFCNLPFIKFLGKISYSLYILSLLCINIIGRIIYSILSHSFISHYGLITNLLATIFTIILTILFSTITFYFIEYPFMKLGRHIYDVINRTLIKTSVPYNINTIENIEINEPCLILNTDKR